MKATINEKSGICTFINMFRCEPKNQEQVAKLIWEANDEVMSKLPGYINSNIHTSDDGEMVVNYVQWASKASFLEIFKNPNATAHMRAITPIVLSSERHFFEVSSVQLAKSSVPATEATHAGA
jgi:heme-degrading monooxygenase HmoA